MVLGTIPARTDPKTKSGRRPLFWKKNNFQSGVLE